MIVVGDFMLDRTVYCTATKLENSAPVLTRYRVEEVPGGAGRVAEAFGCRAVGIVGNDKEGMWLRNTLRTKKATPDLITVPFRQTTVKTRIVCNGHQVLRFDQEDTHPVSCYVENAIVRVVRDERLVLASDYGKGVVTPAVLTTAGDRVIVDPAPGRKYHGVRAIVPNRVEAGNPQTIDEAVEAARRIRSESGCERVIVKLDKDGAVLDTGEHFPAGPWSGSAIGAGDLFLGALGQAIEAGATWEEATQAAVAYRRGRLVLANGCFDILHAGHVRLLEEARRQGDRLIVAIDSDERVRALKGPGRPRQTAEHRAAVLRSLRCVDDVRVFDDLEALIRGLRPSVLVKGADWQGRGIAGADLVERVHFVPLVEGLSSTRLMCGTAERTASST